MTFTLLLALGLAQPSAAAPLPTAQEVDKLVGCRTLGDAAERLACFDREAAALQGGILRREVMVVGREGLSQTRRSLFGLSLPRLAILEGDDKEEIKQIETSLAGTGRNAEGGYVFRLADGSRWSQSDDTPMALAPRAGEPVVVQRGALGSFFLRVGRQPAVKVRRVS